jgi:hypothetical protein
VLVENQMQEAEENFLVLSQVVEAENRQKVEMGMLLGEVEDEKQRQQGEV